MPDHQNRKTHDPLQAAIDANDSQAISSFLNAAEPAEAVHAVSQLSGANQSRVLESLSFKDAASLLEDLPEAQAAQIMERLSARQAAGIVRALPSNEQADVIGRMSVEDASAILNAMPAEDARDARRLMAYPSDTAGGLMITEM